MGIYDIINPQILNSNIVEEEKFFPVFPVIEYTIQDILDKISNIDNSKTITDKKLMIRSLIVLKSYKHTP